MFGLLTRLIGGALSPLIDQVTTFGASLLRKLALFLVAGLCLVVVLLALTLAFGFWISSLAGPVVGALAVAGVYAAVAIVAVVLALRDGKAKPERDDAERPEASAAAASAARDETIDQFTAPILALLQGLGLRREQIAVLAGSSIAKQLRPVPLVGVAIVVGFLVGRMWRGWDALISSEAVEALLAFVMPGRADPEADEAA